jgi:CIC family chloride channel protein
MLAVAIATATSRGLSYGTIYTTKLLRRGIDIDHVPSADPFESLTAADAMRPFPVPLPAAPEPSGQQTIGDPALPGPVTGRLSPQVLFATESLTQAVRQLELYGRDGLPVIADDGQHVEGWITSHNVLQAVARHIRAAGDGGQQAWAAAEQVVPGPRDDPREAPTPLGNYQLIEVTIPADSPSVGLALGDIAWPPGCVPVTVLDKGTLRHADPGIRLVAGNRVSLLAAAAGNPEPSRPRREPGSQPGERPADARPADHAPRPEQDSD